MTETQKDIYFYGHNVPFGFMSNFYKSPFVDYDGIEYNCSEQYFMYKKCLQFDPHNNTLKNNILHETNPTKIKLYGRNVKNYNEHVWNSIREKIMYDANKLKYSQNPDIKQKLILTGNKNLYEASKTDKIWGIGFIAEQAIKTDKNLYGQNLLGKILMKIRNELK
jgi:ribA/ribD-fused uncharacterized protein